MSALSIQASFSQSSKPEIICFCDRIPLTLTQNCLGLCSQLFSIYMRYAHQSCICKNAYVNYRLLVRHQFGRRLRILASIPNVVNVFVLFDLSSLKII